eukprot:UN10154
MFTKTFCLSQPHLFVPSSLPITTITTTITRQGEESLYNIYSHLYYYFTTPLLYHHHHHQDHYQYDNNNEQQQYEEPLLYKDMTTLYQSYINIIN